MKKRLLETVRRTWAEMLGRCRSPEARQLLLWCAPALMAGLILRLILMWQMPHAYFHDDTRFIVKPAESIAHGDFELDPRRPYLVPILWAIPLLLRLPLLFSIAASQHLLGLVFVLGIGLLCRWWFRTWRWWIVPLTVLIALNPVLLWYEHTALPEFLFIFGAVGVVIAGTWLFREPRPLTLGTLLVVLLLNAGTRPEANLLFAFALMIVPRVYWGQWRRLGWALGVTLLVTVVGMKATKTSQGGKLLLTTLLPLIPDHLHTAPAFDERVEPLRAFTREEWQAVPHDVNSTRKRLEALVEEHLVETRGVDKDLAREKVDAFCRRVAFETIARSGLEPVFLSIRKFLRSLEDEKLRHEYPEIPSGNFGPNFVYQEQHDYLYDDGKDEWTSSYRFADLYLGRQPKSVPELDALLHERYQPFAPDWLTAYQVAYYRPFFHWRADKKVYGKDQVPGLPYVYPIALLGLLALSLTTAPRFLNVQQIWLAMLLMLGFAIFLTGNSVGRYRCPLEPYWWIGLFGWLDAAGALALSFFRRGGRGSPTE